MKINRNAAKKIILFAALYIFISGHSIVVMDTHATKTNSQRAAIIDQAGMISPNESFSRDARDILEKEGYIVDYYSHENVTVDFFRNLPAYHYKIIILRVHSLADDYVTFITSERYKTTKYIPLQIDDQLEAVYYTTDDVIKKKHILE